MFRNISSYMYACFMLMSNFAYSAEPFDLNGDPLGMSLIDFKKKYHREVDIKPAPFCSDDSPSGAGIEVSVLYIGLVNCQQQFPFELRQTGLITKIAGYPALITYSFLTEDTVNFENDRLWSIKAVFKHSDYKSIRSSLIEKYGEPIKSESLLMPNAKGASYSFETLVWDNTLSSIKLNEYGEIRLNQQGEDISTSIVLYRLKSLEQEFEKRKEASKNGG